MASCGADSVLFKSIFGTDEMRNVFSDEALVQRWLDVEAALAEAEAEAGVIPPEAAREIGRKARVELIDLSSMARGVELTGHPIVPLIRLLEQVCEGDAGRYVHWGATTQDIMDTGMILQARDAYEIIERQLRSLVEVTSDLAVRHRDTVMAGRTHLQHALPITFGFKAAVWVDEMARHCERLNESKKRVVVGQFAGAVGTLASLGDHAEKVQELLMQKLELGLARTAWHSSRDRIGEFVWILGMVAGTAGKVANEVAALQRTEIAEVEEPFESGTTVGSSTMPHKRNPMMSEGITAGARLVRSMVLCAMEAMDHEHERDMRCWAMEWDFVPRVCVLTSGVLERLGRVLKGLVVKAERMRENLSLLKGLISSEAVMLELAKHIGRPEAHEVIYEDSMRAYREGRDFIDVLLGDPRVRGKIEEKALLSLLDPASYIGLAAKSVDKVAGR